MFVCADSRTMMVNGAGSIALDAFVVVIKLMVICAGSVVLEFVVAVVAVALVSTNAAGQNRMSATQWQILGHVDTF